MNNHQQIPVTVITGFLGTGKTTFLNYLLGKYRETKFALVENEFGDVGVDTLLIDGVDASNMFELKEGCICCTITDEYEGVLMELVSKHPEVEHLLIETTGVADPSAVISPFFRNEKLKKLYRYNGTVCLVDAGKTDWNKEPEIIEKQVAAADVIVLNKSELLTSNQKDFAVDWVKQLNPLGTSYFTQFGKAVNFQLDTLLKSSLEPELTDNVKLHRKVSVRNISFENPLEKERFMRWLSYTLDIYKGSIYRSKGVLYFENDPFEYILQGVGGSFELIEGDFKEGDGTSKIVFIGKVKDLDLKY